MKKILPILLIVGLLAAGCKNGCNKKDGQQPGEDSLNVNLGELPDSLKTNQQTDLTASSQNKDSVLTDLTRQVFTIFRDKDYAQLGALIHPDEGITFSPYATVQENDKKFSRQLFNQLVTADRNKSINWGSYDGSGDPITLTPTEYFSKFVYDANFLKAEQFKVNEFIKTGNSVNNLKTAYSNGDFTESYNSGSKKNGGMDWKAVRLVFKEVNGKYYLVGIVHDQWTI